MRQLDLSSKERFAGEDQIESAILNYETAFRMQAAVPDLMDLSGESDTVKKM
jgi:hypothetical protein